jgi:long-chain acyl-CoA synthetase
VTLETVALDLVELSRQQAITRPERVAITFQGSESTYHDLDERANRVANGLLALSNTVHARVALLDKNSDAFYELWFGAAKARNVAVPVNWRLAPAELAYIINDATAEVLFVGEEFLPMVDQIRPELLTVKQIIAASGSHPAWESYRAWRDRQANTDPRLPTQRDDVAVQLYTSGTTGHPKGVEITHRNLFAAVAAAPEWYPCTADDVNLACMPQFHLTGNTIGLFGLTCGARTVILREATPAEILRVIPTERVTIAAFVPALLLFMLQTPGSHEVDFSSLRHITYGASPIAENLVREALTIFKCDFAQVYGLTEVTGAATLLPPADHDPAGNPRMRSCGKPLSNAEVKIIGADGIELGSDEVGEVVLRSPQTMNGYWNLPEATAAALRDGWLHTGDAGYRDGEGYLYIYDRIKDMIISGAENVYPAEVESVLFGHPAMADVAVIGVPDATWGEAVKAVVVLRPTSTATEAELIAYCRDRIAHYKAPKSVDFVDSLPRNPSGKILKRVLRAPYWAGRERQVN